MKVNLLNKKGEKVKDLELDKSLLVDVSSSSLTLYINYLRNAVRGAVANTKDRSEVSGGGKKPYKQKGTGRARAGSSRSPLWVGGGVTFGPNNDQTFKTRINKSTKKKVILGSIGKFFKDKKAYVIDDLSFDQPKTKEALSVLKSLNAEGKISLIYGSNDQNAYESFRNVAGLNVMVYSKLDFVNLISSNNLIISEDALGNITQMYKDKELKKNNE